MNDEKFVAFVGDVHGDLPHMLRVIDRMAALGVTAIVQLGDFGFDNEQHLGILTFHLRKYGMILYYIDGNHENHHWILTHEILNGFRPITERIVHLPRGFRWEWQGIEYLAMGGAHSVDKSWRTPGLDWFPEETITYEQADEAMAGGKADIMLCHDVPSGVDIKAIWGNPMGWPDHAIRASQHHRDVLRVIIDEVRPYHIFSGHYHTFEHHLLKGKDYLSRVHILDMNGGCPWYENIAVTDHKTFIFGEDLKNFTGFGK